MPTKLKRQTINVPEELRKMMEHIKTHDPYYATKSWAKLYTDMAVKGVRAYRHGDVQHE